MTTYHILEDMICMIDEPNQQICRTVLKNNKILFMQAAGSSHNHQAWSGGYLDHITEVMNIWLLLYGAFESTGRLAFLKPEERFSRSDGLVVLFWHDIEKPWSFVLQDDKPVVDKRGSLRRPADLVSKAARKQLAEDKIREFGVVLTPQLQNALDYVEGIRDTDYSQFDRKMLPLAALCHACDMLSARAFYNFPLIAADPWKAQAD